MTLFACCGMLVLYLPAALPSPVAVDAATAKIKKPDAVVEEKDVELDITAKSFRFMLEQLPVSAMLARELGIADVAVHRLDDGYLFSDPWFKLWLESAAVGKGNEHNFEFRYSIGLHGLMPIKTAGKGSAIVKVKSSGRDTVVADITMRLKTFDSPIDKVARKVPFIITAFFRLKLEQALHQAEGLAYEFKENPNTVMEIVDDEYSEFTTAEKKAVKKFLDRKARS